MRGLAPKTYERINGRDVLCLDDIPIKDLSADFFASVTLAEAYDFLVYLSRDRDYAPASQKRTVVCLRSFYHYIAVREKLIPSNPLEELEAPKVPQSLPHFLTLDESKRLLNAVKGRNKDRDYCILVLFLNCGMRVSELCNMELGDLREDKIVLHGKGSKDRIVYLNDSACKAINDWLVVRRGIDAIDKTAFFLSNRRKKMSVDAVELLVRKHILAAGLDASVITPHKLRHTSATLLLENGVDVRTIQDILGHKNLNTTSIYAHVTDTELQIAANANPLAEFDV